MLVLGIESSCDETAISVVKDGREILSNVVSSQVEEHRKYGGVVPEIASRRHCENISWVLDKALSDADVTLSDIDALAVTYAPGLIGALLVGVNFAKGLSMSTGIPLVPVHHLRGHIASNYLTHQKLEPPFLCLVVSGGHSHIIEVLDYTDFRVIGRTRDDAAGEAYDKAARTMGFDYPGGVTIDKNAKLGNPNTYKLPYPKLSGNEFDFSFSGIKTAVINLLHNAQQKGEEVNVNDLCASFQKTVCEILSDTTLKAANSLGYDKIVVAGGVSANSGLREKLTAECEKQGKELYFPHISLCGDNGAMIASQGYYEFLSGKRGDMSLNAIASLPICE